MRGLARSRALWSLLLAGSFLAGLLPTITAAAAPACQPGPVVRETEINQGLPGDQAGPGSFGPLARGKKTQVKLHLSLNECSTSLSSPSVQITAATLEVSPALGSSSTATLLQAPSGSVTPCCASTTNSSADPRWLVDGSQLQAAASPGPLSANFVATLRYSSSSGSTPTTTGTLTHSFTASLQDTRPIRILAAPMGVPSQGYRTWFPVADDAVFQNAAASAMRALPVAQGACSPIQVAPVPPSQPECGIQYDFPSDLVNISDLLRGGLFCGTQDSFNALRPRLAQFLAAYNLQNPTRPADVIVGLIDRGKVDPSCSVVGMSAVGSAESWVQVIPDSKTTPSPTGGILVQEILHNWAIRGPATDDEFSPFHSPASEFDGGTQRALNTTTGAYLPDDKSVLRFSIFNWHNHNVGLEAEDWRCAIVALGGSAACPVSPPAIGSSPAAEGEAFSIACETDGTPAGTSCTSTRGFTATTGQDDASDYRLVYLCGPEPGAATECRSFGVAVSDESTHADHGSSTGVIQAAFPWEQAVARVELRHAAPGGELTLWSVDASAVPTDVIVKVRPAEWVFTDVSSPTDPAIPADDVEPAVSPPGGDPLVVWIKRCADGGGAFHAIRIPAGGAPTASTPCMSPMPRQPDIRPGNREIAFVQGGDLKVIAFRPELMEFGPVQTRYLCAPVTGAVCRKGQPTDPTLQGPVSGPAYSPGGERIAFSVEQVTGGELAMIDLRDQEIGGQLVPPTRLTFTPDVDEREPSWDHTLERAASARIVFERCVLANNETSCPRDRSQLHTIDPPEAGGIVQNLPATPVAGTRAYHDPTWVDGFILAEAAGEIRSIFPQDAGTAPSEVRVTGPGTGFEASASTPSGGPSLGPIAFASSGSGQSDSDVIVATSRRAETEISIEARDESDDLYAHVWADCADGPRRPMRVRLDPDTRQGDAVTFHTTFDPNGTPTCGDATVLAGVSDYFGTGTNAHQPSLDSSPKPHRAAINWPADGAVVSNVAPLTLDGSVLDPDQPGEAAGSADNPNLRFEWYVDGLAVGTGPQVRLPSPLALGPHLAELVVREVGSSQVSRATAGFTVVDGSATGRFDPATWQIPSNGVVTYFVTLPAGAPRAVGRVQITEVNGRPVTSGADWRSPATSPFVANTFRVDGGLVTAKFDRSEPSRFFQANGLVGTRVLLTVEVTACERLVAGSCVQPHRYVTADWDRPVLQPA